MKKLTSLRVMAGFMALFGLAAACQAVDFHVTSAQSLQNALTLAAANGSDNNVYLAAGYYSGNFNYNSADPNALTLQAESGVTNNQITLDGAGTGRTMSLSCSVNGAISVSGLTYLRNCGNANYAALSIATGANVLVSNCRFLSSANSSGGGLLISSGLNATVIGCTAVGTSDTTTGIYISGVPGDVTVQNCTLNTNSLDGLIITGAGIITVTNSTFNGNYWQTQTGWQNNICGQGGGAYCKGSSVILAGNSFNGNWVNNGNNEGGGAFCNGSVVTVSGNMFGGNSSGSGGGAVACIGTTVAVSGNTFNGNSASVQGGGAYCYSSSSLTLSGNTFNGNTCTGGSAGAGAYCSGTSIVLTGNTFSGNSAVDNYNWGGPPWGCGGGAYCDGAATLSGNAFANNFTSHSGGGVYCDNSSTLTNNSFTANSAAQDGGGACCWAGGVAMTLAANTAMQNSAQSGGGFYIYSGTVTFLNNLVQGNTQTGFTNYGGGVYVDAGTELDMINNTIFANNALGGGGGAAFQVDGVTEILHVYNNIIWGNTANANGADVHLAGTGQRKQYIDNDSDDMSGVWDLATTLDIDPQFYDPVNGDYHLRSTSGLVNTGDNSAPDLPSTDLDGGPRIVGGVVDIGCYEFNNSAFMPADTNSAWTITSAEFNAYGNAWLNSLGWTIGPSPIPANFATRAGYLLQSTGTGAYYNDGSAQPTNWKPGAP
jgi:hypothetical protein